MCGRFSLFAPRWVIEDRFEATFEYPYERRYNAAPGQALPVIADERPGRIRAQTWGLVPTWTEADAAGTGHVNARAETAAEKPSFRDAFAGVGGDAGPDAPAAGRCLVLADGYYEWSEAGQPHRVARTDGDPFAMAGLWTRWRPSEEQTGLDRFGGGGADDAGSAPAVRSTFAVVTTTANEVVAPIHDRMPVILPASTERRWLTADPDGASDLLEPASPAEVEAHPVSRAVNDAGNDSPAVLSEGDASG